jgi:SSS family solute:Na+ symporter
LAGYFKLLPVFIFMIPGMIAFALYKKGLLAMPMTAAGQPDADRAFSSLVANLLPIGFKGIVVCGLLAALMSSLASLFNSSAALFIGDFYKKLRPSVSERHLVVAGRVATTVIVILGIVWIPVMKGLGNVLYRYLQAVQGLLAPAIAAAFVMGVFWRGSTPAGGLTGLALGFILGMYRLVLNVLMGSQAESIARLTGEARAQAYTEALQRYGWQFHIASVNWLHYTVGLFILCIAVTALVSAFTRKPSSEQLRFTYWAASPEEKAATRASWNAWDVIHTAVILGVIIAFYCYFWKRY